MITYEPIAIYFILRMYNCYNRINDCSFQFRPLLYGLELEEDFKVLRTYEFQSKDYQVILISMTSDVMFSNFVR